MRLLNWWLRSTVGPELARDIAGDVAELGGGVRMLFGIAMAITWRRCRERIGTWQPRRSLRPVGAAELRSAWRSLRLAPWYTATAALAVALSVALSATVFAVVDGVLFRPLPYARASELFAVVAGVQQYPETLVGQSSLSPRNLDTLRGAAPAIDFTGFIGGGRVDVADDVSVRSASVDDRFFDVIGMRPFVGGFATGDFAPAVTPPPIVLTWGLWQRQFGGDPAIVGKVVGSSPASQSRVVGVLPRTFLFPTGVGVLYPEALTATATTRADQERSRYLRVIARVPSALRPGAAVQQLTGALRGNDLPPPVPANASEALRRSRAPLDTVRLDPLDIAMTATSRTQLLPAFWAAMLIALLAVASVCGLTAARVQDRRTELRVRAALGSTPADVFRLLCLESGVLVAGGSVLGFGLAVPLMKMTSRLLPSGLLLFKTPELDLRVLAMVIAQALVIATLNALWSLKTAASGGRAGLLVRPADRVRTLGRTVVVIAEVAVATVMLVTSSLVVKSLVRAWSEDLGVRVDNSMLLELRNTDRVGGGAPEFISLVSDVATLAGVTAAGGFDNYLLRRIHKGSSFDAPPGVLGDDSESIAVTAGFFGAAGLQLRAGRLPSASELSGGSRVVVVSESVAAQYWPGRSPIGQRLKRKNESFEVVGVVKDIRHLALDLEPKGATYYPMAHADQSSTASLLVTLASDDGRLGSAVVDLLARRYPSYRLLRATPLAAAMGASIVKRQLQAWLFGVFASVALVIVGTGLFGLIATVTSRRTREIGVRMALGSTSERVVRLILAEELRPVVIGLLLGAAGAAWSAKLLGAMLYKMPWFSPSAWMPALALLLMVSFTAVLVPAVRASRINPVLVLRAD